MTKAVHFQVKDYVFSNPVIKINITTLANIFVIVYILFK